MKRMSIDLETDGLCSDTNRIIEIAVLYEDGPEESRAVFHQYVLPETKSEGFDEAAKVSHGLSWEFLEKNGKAEEDVFIELIKWLDERFNKYDPLDRAFFLAYNAKFDNEFIWKMFKRYETGTKDDAHYGSYFRKGCVIDILPIVAATVDYGMLPVPENFQNKTIAKLLDIPLENAHSALEDIKASRLIYLKCLQLINQKNKKQEAV